MSLEAQGRERQANTNGKPVRRCLELFARTSVESRLIYSCLDGDPPIEHTVNIKIGADMHIDQDTGKPFCLFPTKALEADLSDYHDRACKHAELRLVRSVIKNGSIQYRDQCQQCGELQGNPRKHADVPADVPSRDETLEPRYYRDRDEELRAIYQKHIRKQKERDTEWWARYHRHMKSAEWAVIREKVFRRANGLCEGCMEKPATQVHHLTYENMGSEFLFELVAVCTDCHERAHLHDEEEDEAVVVEQA